MVHGYGFLFCSGGRFCRQSPRPQNLRRNFKCAPGLYTPSCSTSTSTSTSKRTQSQNATTCISTHERRLRLNLNWNTRKKSVVAVCVWLPAWAMSLHSARSPPEYQ